MTVLAEGPDCQLPADRPPREAGQEPLPGYRLLEPLGRGGFGEVWKCAVSGGLVKAIKFVDGAGPAEQELAALEQIKTIRHPFLLSIERIETVNDTLVIVTELADRNLQAVLLACQMQGEAGIPREQLLGFLSEAAEALDEISFRHGLQHLDVKPHNLFVIGNHVKVGDFGLVCSLGSGQRSGGLTPLYAAPELYRSCFSQHSDQYSLAVVYQQLLTGTVPFASTTPEKIREQHLNGSPDLSALGEADRPIVARALAKDPESRYPSCQAFIQALVLATAPGASDSGTRSVLVQRVRQRLRELGQAGNNKTTPLPVPLPDRSPARAAAPSSGGLTRPSLPSQANPVTPQALQKTCVQISGYRFLECEAQSPLGEVWTVEDRQGRQRLGICLIPMPQASSLMLAQIQALRHPALPVSDLFLSPAGRMVLVTDAGKPTLRQVLEQYRKKGQAGIPRPQLLTWLRSAAQALDELAGNPGLCHLGLNPNNLLIDGNRLLLADFGLVPLVWAPTGQSPDSLNQRYAAPELATTKTGGPASDQYSLALIYAEMLSGIYPRLNIPGSRSGQHRRPNLGQPQSGQPRMIKGFDLDFLPASDREIITRALSPDPSRRFASCTALVDALEQNTVGATVRPEISLAALPLVVPVECLLGKEPPARNVVPQPGQMIAQLITTVAGSVAVRFLENTRYWRNQDGSWESRCPVPVQSSLLRYKLDGFRDQWKAEKIRADDHAFVCRLITRTTVRGVWPFAKTDRTGLEVWVQLPEPTAGDQHLLEAFLRIRPLGEVNADQDLVHRSLVPQLFQGLRAYLQANPEQRNQQRWPCELPLRVFALSPSREIAGVLEGQTRNISQGGLSFVTGQKLCCEHLYLNFHQSNQLSRWGILGQAVRIQTLDNGQTEMGVSFVVGGSPVR